MTVCTVCGEKDFEELGGHFYCTTCNTQSQSYRVIVVDTEEGDAWHGHSQVIREKKSQEKKEKAAVDHGRPWSIYEAFQIVLQHQVEALIKLGADPSLSDKVFKLWRNYLSKLGVAFSDGPVVEELQKYERQREKFPGTLKKPLTQNVLGSSRRRQTLGPPMKEAEKQLEADAMANVLEGEEFYEGDNPLKDIGSEDKDEDEYSSEDNAEIELWGRSRRDLAHDNVYKMTLSKTLSLCYLGLMYTNPLTTLSDIIRWAKTHKIPFRKVKSLLPSDMKFALQDWMLFGMDIVPSWDTLSTQTGCLAYFLGLQNFPEFPLRQLISKYLLQLCLPGELHGMAVKLMMIDSIPLSYRPRRTYKKLAFWEGIAMAYVVVTLKLVFGLNNHTERLLSVYTRELMNLNDKGDNLFVFDDWINYMRKTLNISEMNFQQGSDSGLPSTKTIRSKDCVVYKDRQDKRLYKQVTRDKLQAPFLELSKYLGTSQSCGPGNQSSSDAPMADEFDLSSNTLLTDDPVGFLLGQHEEDAQDTSQETQEQLTEKTKNRIHELKQEGKRFRCSSIEHLIYSNVYLNHLEASQMIGDNVYSSCAETASELEGVDQDDDDNCVYSSQRKRRKIDRKSQTQSKDKIKSSLSHFIEAESCSIHQMSKVKDRARYQHVCDRIKHLHENFQLTLDSNFSDAALGSYYGLLEMCSCIIGSTRQHVETEVRKIEAKFFADLCDLSARGRSNYRKVRHPSYATQRLKMV